MNAALPLPVVDGLALPAEVRALLRPGEAVTDAHGRVHHLPRFFYEVPSWARAKETLLTPHVRLSELLVVDCREAGRLLEKFPHYVPCAVGLLARLLEEFRAATGNVPVHVATNGGYRSPAHALANPPDAHCWAAAADVYRVGDTFLDGRTAIEKHAALARDLGGVGVAPYGHGPGETDDHLHLELGYVHLIPPTCDETAS